MSSNGLFFVSKDGGNKWTKKTSPCVKDTTHSSPAFGAEAWLAVSADGKKLLAQAWFFEETVLAITGENASHTDGYRNAQWILLDYSDIMVHIFQKEYRGHYDLESLWADAKIKSFNAEN